MTTQNNTTAHRDLLTRLAGQPYSACRHQLDVLDWDGWYPEVDIDGRLTGKIVEASSTEHEIAHDGWTMIRVRRND